MALAGALRAADAGLGLTREEVGGSLAMLAALRAARTVDRSSSGTCDAERPASGCELPAVGRPARLVGLECGGVRRLALLLYDEVREWNCSGREGVMGRCTDDDDVEADRADDSIGAGSGGRSGSVSKCSLRVG